MKLSSNERETSKLILKVVIEESSTTKAAVWSLIHSSSFCLIAASRLCRELIRRYHFPICTCPWLPGTDLRIIKQGKGLRASEPHAESFPTQVNSSLICYSLVILLYSVIQPQYQVRVLMPSSQFRALLSIVWSGRGCNLQAGVRKAYLVLH